MEDYTERIESLRPWRYNHAHGDIKIIADDQSVAESHDRYYKETLIKMLNKVCKHLGPINELRILDLGCLEGHYSDMFCNLGFQEVVSIDLSEKHIERAKFLLHTLKKYENSTIIHGNILSEDILLTLGKFDIIFFHGLLYHLSSPVMIFDLIDRIIKDRNNFFMFLSHQFHIDYNIMVSPFPIAELKIRRFKPDSKGHVFSPKDESVFNIASIRLNPKCLYNIFNAYGYKEVVSYDTPSGIEHKLKNFAVHFVLSKKQIDSLHHELNNEINVDGFKFKKWDGESIDHYRFDNNLRSNVIRLMIKLTHKINVLFEKIGLYFFVNEN